MRRREFISLIAGATAWPLGARAQQPAMPVIGVLGPATAEVIPHLLAAFRRGLAEAGYVDGKNLIIEYRFPNYKLKLLPGLARDLVQRNVKVIFASIDSCRGQERNDRHSHRCARFGKRSRCDGICGESCAAGRQSDRNVS
jgi:hypothetical protein